jgi:hypothetical protein
MKDSANIVQNITQFVITKAKRTTLSIKMIDTVHPISLSFCRLSMF